jgi:CarD family transcriptional regulator
MAFATMFSGHTLAEYGMVEPKIGQLAVYPLRGVAEFKCKEEKQVMGRNLTFWILQVLDSNEKIMIPVGKLETCGLREVIDDKEADEVFAILRARDVNVSDETWVRRYRSYDEKLKTGSIHEVAEVLRDLILRKDQKELSFGERRMLDKARRLLVQEIAIAKELVSDDVEDELNQIFAC